MNFIFHIKKHNAFEKRYYFLREKLDEYGISNVEHFRYLYKVNDESNVNKVNKNNIYNDKSISSYHTFRKFYSKFLYMKFFLRLEKPLIICEGKTDYIYLKCALKSLSLNNSNLIKIDEKEKYKIDFFRVSEKIEEIFNGNHIFEGSNNLKKFITSYYEIFKEIKIKNPYFLPKFPVIVLLDNDDGAKDTICYIKNLYNKLSINFDRSKNYFFISDNLYVITMPKDGGKIEDFFREDILSTKLNGKTFNPENKIDITTQYGKNIFATHVVLPNRDKINFEDFQNILNLISIVISDYTNKLLGTK
jgi:hypothetical protein